MAEINVTLVEESPVINVSQQDDAPEIHVQLIGSGPAGVKGDKGDTGARGPKGDKGDTGAAGAAGAAGADGVSPAVTITDITGGHRVTVTDADHPNGQTFDVMDGQVSAAELLKAFPTDAASGAVASFPDGADGVPVKSLAVTVRPVQTGSGDPAPDNVRPIYGRTGATILRAGVNLFNKTTATLGKSINGSGGITNRSGTDAFYSDFIPIYAEVGMKYRHTAPGVSGKTMCIVLYDRNKNWIRGEATPSAGGNTCAITIKQTDVDAGAAYLRISAYSAGVYDNAMCTVGNDVVEEYSPYAGASCQVSWQSEAGTVYGGTLDVTTGVLTVDRGIVTFDGSNDESWTFGLSSGIYRAYIAVADIDTSAENTSVLDLLCNEFKAGSYSGRGANSVTGRSGIAQLNFFQNTYTTIDEWTAFLAGSPATVVYPLSVPTTCQLTPQEVSSLLGENSILADAGPVSVVYRADPTLFIRKLAGPADDDMTADDNIASGTYFLVGNALYLSTAAIAAGAAIVPGANCTPTNLAEALNALNS